MNHFLDIYYPNLHTLIAYRNVKELNIFDQISASISFTEDD